MFRSPMVPRVRSESLSRGVINGQERRTKERYKDEGGHTLPRSPDEIQLYKQGLLERFRGFTRSTSRRTEREILPDTHTSDAVGPEISRSTPERFTQHELGRQASETEPELPVRAFKEAFLESVAHNQITICTAETGAGKSTQFPQYLLEMGYNVSMTQPRRISASLVAQQVQKELIGVLGDDAEGLVGCHTGGENTITEGKTRITVVTDGLRLVQEFGERDELEHEVLIIDEVHEWNCNIEVLVAQVKRLTKQKPELRIVILSATMEAEELADYFSDGTSRPPIMDIPGRNFEVEGREEAESTVVDQAVKYAEEGHNILIFLPGVREIEDTMGAIQKELASKGITNATILPLHSKLSKQEQEAVMGSYPGPKIICATNIAQTSITIPDVTRVIMSGLERRTEIDGEGVQSLNLRPVSRKDMIQQAGRCGRVENGEAVLTCLNDDTLFIPHDSEARTEYPIPEILRTDVDRNVLLVASKGLDFAELELFHPVEPSVIARSKRALYVLGALDKEGKITNQGTRMIQLPMRPMYSRMMTYAEDQNYNANTRTYVAAMVSAMEVGGMPSWLRDSSRDWRDKVEETDNSDHLSQLRLFIAAQQMPEREKYEIGLDVHNVERAQELFRKVCKRSNIPMNARLVAPNEEELRLVRDAVTAGLIDYVYEKSGRGYIRSKGATQELRDKGNRTTISGLPVLVVGNPVGIERPHGSTFVKESIIQNVTAIQAADLGRVATWLCEWEDAGLRWSRGRLQRVQRQLFKSIPTGILKEEDATATPEAIKEVERYVMIHSGKAFTELKEIKRELEVLRRLTTNIIPAITQDDLEGMIRSVMNNGEILDPGYIDQLIREIMIESDFRLDTLVSPEDRQKIYDNAPASIEHQDTQLDLTYHNGIPRHHFSDPGAVAEWTEEPHLPDGRVIQLFYKRQEHTLDELQQLVPSR